ncbi:alpha/beta hydrolase [Bdellovibrio sp. 22V]|uniref:alpha/beta fold hydrolase n=1 Tax=Bdellovibrio TaxID=958 RepID=UPI002542D1E7|nr:alpha/beta hydrolase [Bdellovibrio sp. 22V]WII71514.1 alpha/beta hydrolase [Bdellovibrio sp. 22V]
MSGSLDLRSFKIPLGKLAPQESFRTRQGDVLSYRLYPAWSEDLIILYHGVGSDSRYMCVLASALAAAGLGTVVTPDFRGHGISLPLSDKIKPAQLEIDLEELIIHLRMQRAVSRITLAGHSLGGGFVLRVAVSDIRTQFANFVALAPHLPLSFHSFQEGFGGWISLTEEGGFRVNMPENFRSGQEKLSYSPEFLAAVQAPEDLVARLQSLRPALKVLTGTDEEVARPEVHRQIFTEAGVPVEILPGLNHLTLVSKPDAVVSRF